MAYADPADIKLRYDFRSMGDLVSDNDTQETSVALDTDTVLAAVLGDASGDVDAALMVAGRYSSDDLTGLTGNSLSKLKRITCDIAMAYLLERRPGYNIEMAKQVRETADDYLEKLRKGENVFNIPAKVEAGTPHVDGPSTLDYQSLNLLRDRVQHTYPARHLPGNR